MTTDTHFGTPLAFTSLFPVRQFAEPQTIVRAKSGTASPTESLVGDAHVVVAQTVNSTQSAIPSLSRSSRPVEHVGLPHTARSTTSGMESLSASQAVASLVAGHGEGTDADPA